MITYLMMSPGGESGSSSFIFIGLMIFIFYFFMIRPQQKKMKNQKNFIDNLKNGDKVVTNGGIHGKIVETNDETFVIQSVDSKLKIERSAISLDLSASFNKVEEKAS